MKELTSLAQLSRAQLLLRPSSLVFPVENLTEALSADLTSLTWPGSDKKDRTPAQSKGNCVWLGHLAPGAEVGE